MPVPTYKNELSISLVAVPESSAAVLYSLHEVFAAVGSTWEQLTGAKTHARRISPRIVAKSEGNLQTTMGVTVTTSHTFSDMHYSNVVIVPDLMIKPGSQLSDLWPEATQWIREQYRHGAVICSVCTGSLMLAEAGILDNQEAATHWSARRTFAECYPKVLLKPERVLLPTGEAHRIVTSGGSASWNDLVLYLIARFCGEEEARRIAKIFLFGDRGEGQLPFTAMVRPRQHEDSVIASVQSWVADHYATPAPVAKMIDLSGLASRTFKRRFKAATGYTPIDYVQTLRMEEAKQMLEATDADIDDIAEEVGYADSSAFRRLFKRRTGVSPHNYRKRFKAIGAAS
ncbi:MULTISPECIES: GlxA family transcriptional regulator [Kordiimonas]|jgi:transcriptional regulator GlxA family with amidase domain|uniref:GlxA family transcriptional regulator n=1 Tax=Kordiimonas TaxID=288021 RepID=UPI00257A495C|nr:helix-turn-helix domain-containing protein [Kordiimonas sp. UBA4487]